MLSGRPAGLHMNLQFGSWWFRLIRGGVRLAPLEQRLLVVFREHLPELFHAPLDAQLAAINLAQRVAGWKGINLYRIRRGRVYRDDLPPLPCKTGEVRLSSLAIGLPNLPEPIHVAFWAVDRVIFGFGTEVSLKPFQGTNRFLVTSVRHSWRSNVETVAGGSSDAPVGPREEGTA